MNIISKIRGWFKKRVTILFIPQGKKRHFKITISIMAMCVFMGSWTCITILSGYFAGRDLDYAATKADNKIMKFRLLFLANRLEKIEDMFEQTRQNDEKIRNLLSLNTRESIIKTGLIANSGKGGPLPVNINILMSTLSGKPVDLQYSKLSYQTDMLCEKYKFMKQSYDEIITHIDKQKTIFMATPCGWPCDGRITSVYGFRVHPIYLVKEFHSGLDIANELHTPIFCTANGKVAYSGWQSGYGNIIVVDHGHNYRTVYGHLSKKLVKTGDCVSRGQMIAQMGNTGSSTGSHLHYEVHFKGRTVNPKQYLADHFFC
jgi:murein DD-endopeptidase MepM/ murein hydrolase activator NlpD